MILSENRIPLFRIMLQPLRTSLYVMSNAGIRRAPGVVTCLARLIQNRQAATGAENNNQS
jgi:hypothetical protein